jgi:phenylpyruvate tautomerase PptA (4-oxalocrotonate tautomerase family)
MAGLGTNQSVHSSMPIVDVEIVGSESLASDLAARLADMAGQVFCSPPASTWVRVRLLPRHHYAENGTEKPAGWNSVFVTVLKAQRPAGAALEVEVRALTEGVARVCGRSPENVHILYDLEAQGRIAFGGRLRG